MLKSAIILSLIAGVLGTGIGGLIGVFLGKTSKKLTSRMFNFASGVMLGIVFFDLLPRALEMSGLII
ncbi:MAG: ZIP family metal transporter, partial [Clostridia bacterium]